MVGSVSAGKSGVKAPGVMYGITGRWEFGQSGYRHRVNRLYRLRKNSKSVIPRARFARRICFFLRIGEKADPSLRSG
jgi:hypothetical protein